MASKVFPEKMADLVLMDYRANKGRWETKVNQESRDHPEMMDLEDHKVSVVYLDYLELMGRVSKEKLAKKEKRDQLDNPVKMVEKGPKVNQQLST